jgi:hypothetical protein
VAIAARDASRSAHRHWLVNKVGRASLMSMHTCFIYQVSAKILLPIVPGCPSNRPIEKRLDQLTVDGYIGAHNQKTCCAIRSGRSEEEKG